MCHACFYNLYLFDTFKKKCLEAESRIICYISSNPRENPVDLSRMINTDKDQPKIHNLPETETTSKSVGNKDELMDFDTKENISTHVLIIKQEHDYVEVRNYYIVT